LLLYCFIQLSKPGPQVGNDRVGINGGRATARSRVDSW